MPNGGRSSTVFSCIPWCQQVIQRLIGVLQTRRWTSVFLMEEKSARHLVPGLVMSSPVGTQIHSIMVYSMRKTMYWMSKLFLLHMIKQLIWRILIQFMMVMEQRQMKMMTETGLQKNLTCMPNGVRFWLAQPVLVWNTMREKDQILPAILIYM